MTGAAAFEENAELEELRDRADETGREAAQTLAELTGRLADARDPKVVTRRLAARARHTMASARQRMPDNLAVSRGVKRAVLAGFPALGLLALAVVARHRGWPPLGPQRPSRTSPFPVQSRPSGAARLRRPAA